MKVNWKSVINFVITVLTAVLSSFCVQSCTHLGFWTAGIDHAILRNVIVVTDGAETTGLVAGFQGFYREVLVNTCGTAMYHNQIDFSLILHGFLWIIKNISLAGNYSAPL